MAKSQEKLKIIDTDITSIKERLGGKNAKIRWKNYGYSWR